MRCFGIKTHFFNIAYVPLLALLLTFKPSVNVANCLSSFFFIDFNTLRYFPFEEERNAYKSDNNNLCNKKVESKIP